MLSEPLQDLLGCGETLPRTEMVKGLWSYIKSNDLQNPKNKSEILPDSKMKKVFGAKPFTVRASIAYSCSTSAIPIVDSPFAPPPLPPPLLNFPPPADLGRKRRRRIYQWKVNVLLGV